MTHFEMDVTVSFGDCDPAGIVFYPNYFRWMDATFHAFLHANAGGHSAICQQLGARGLGLMDTKLSFRSPASEGSVLRYAIQAINWASRSLDVIYTAHQGERLVLEGNERRGVFIVSGGKMKAGGTAPLREILKA